MNNLSNFNPCLAYSQSYIGCCVYFRCDRIFNALPHVPVPLSWYSHYVVWWWHFWSMVYYFKWEMRQHNQILHSKWYRRIRIDAFMRTGFWISQSLVDSCKMRRKKKFSNHKPQTIYHHQSTRNPTYYPVYACRSLNVLYCVTYRLPTAHIEHLQ